MDNLSDQVGGGFNWHVLVGKAIFACLMVELSILDVDFDIGFRVIVVHTVLV